MKKILLYNKVKIRENSELLERNMSLNNFHCMAIRLVYTINKRDLKGS